MFKPAFYKYVQPSIIASVLPPIAGLIVCASMTIALHYLPFNGTLKDKVIVYAIIAVFWILIIRVFIHVCISPQLAIRKQLKLLQEEGLLKIMEDDFLDSEECLYGKIRLGGKYVFGHGTGIVVPVEDIKSIRLSGTEYYGDANYTMWVIHISEFGPYMNEQPLCSFHSAYEYLFSKRDYEAFGKRLMSINPDLKVAENVDMRSEKVTKHHDDD